jgi:DNA-nicking Smr family endonuclease
VLREVIPRWLAADGRDYVAEATPEPDATGADGAMRVKVVRLGAAD